MIELEQRLAEAEETLRAIRQGEVDALVVNTEQGDQVFTIRGADRAYRTAVEEMNEGALTVDERGTILFCNRSFARMVGTPLERVLAASIYDFAVPEARDALSALLQNGAGRQEIALKARDGSLVPALVSPTFLKTNDFAATLLIVTNLREQKQGEEELRSLTRRLVQTQEEERRNVARELHDQIGQLLTYLTLVMDKATKERADREAQALTEANSIVQQLVKQVRSLSLNLRPAMLDDLGLIPTLLWLTEQYNSETGFRVDFRHGELPVLPPEVATTAFRIVQEALTNVVRHAQVRQATVRIWAGEELLHLEIADNGIGFELKPKMASTGLSAMRERTLALGGSFKVESTPGTGTLIRTELPLPKAKEA